MRASDEQLEDVANSIRANPQANRVIENIKHFKADGSPSGIMRKQCLLVGCLVCAVDLCIVGLGAGYALSHMPTHYKTGAPPDLLQKTVATLVDGQEKAWLAVTSSSNEAIELQYSLDLDQNEEGFGVTGSKFSVIHARKSAHAAALTDRNARSCSAAWGPDIAGMFQLRAGSKIVANAINAAIKKHDAASSGKKKKKKKNRRLHDRLGKDSVGKKAAAPSIRTEPLVAVVGLSGNLYSSKRGELIDRHPIVFRTGKMGDATAVKGHEKDVGHYTTFRIVHDHHDHEKDPKGEKAWDAFTGWGLEIESDTSPTVVPLNSSWVREIKNEQLKGMGMRTGTRAGHEKQEIPEPQDPSSSFLAIAVAVALSSPLAGSWAQTAESGGISGISAAPASAAWHHQKPTPRVNLFGFGPSTSAKCVRYYNKECGAPDKPFDFKKKSTQELPTAAYMLPPTARAKREALARQVWAMAGLVAIDPKTNTARPHLIRKLYKAAERVIVSCHIWSKSHHGKIGNGLKALQQKNAKTLSPPLSSSSAVSAVDGSIPQVLMLVVFGVSVSIVVGIAAFFVFRSRIRKAMGVSSPSSADQTSEKLLPK